MTEKLYYADSHMFEFSAVITEISETSGHYSIVLDRTAFFPEGGGQPADEGFIGTMRVDDVREKDGRIYHFIEGEPAAAVGESVFCRLDRETRFMRMQSHSGEHILSGVAHTLFGAENVGFHMIDCVMTVDLDKPLTAEQIKTLEREANEVVYRNAAFTVQILSGEELNGIEYRSKLAITENVRIVTVEGCDKCACCAPHVSFAGEIGLIKILSSVSHRGGVRLTVICGRKAYEDYAEKHSAVTYIASLLKVPSCEAAEAVDALSEKLLNEKHEKIKNSKRLTEYIFHSIPQGKENILLFVDGFSNDELRELAQLCKSRTDGIFSVFTGNDDEGYSFAVSSLFADMKKTAGLINSALPAHSGGRGEMIQGRTAASEAEIRKLFNTLEV